MLSERRASPRVNVRECFGMILVDVTSLRTTGLLVDLSEDGLGVQFTAPMPDVATVDVGFPLGQRWVVGTCDVIWSAPGTGAAGLRFRDLPSEDRAEIRSCLQGLPAAHLLTPNVAATDVAATDVAATDVAAADVAAADCEASPSWQEAATTIIADNEPWEFGAALEVGAPETTISDIPASSGLRDSQVIEESATSNADAPGALPPIRTGAGGSGGLPKSTEPEWAVRIAARRQEELRVWRDEKLAPVVSDENARATSPIDVAISAPGLPSETDEISRSLDARPLTPVHKRRSPRGIWWAIVLIITVAVVVVLWQLRRSEERSVRVVDTAASEPVTSQAGRAESLQRPVGGIMEVIEGKPVAHSDALNGRRPEAITGGAVVARDLPTYDDEALASGLQGDVHAVLTISDRGVVQEVRVTQGNSVLARQVINAAEHWRFSPYFDDFGPVSVELPVTFRFHLMTGAGVQSRKPG